MLSYPLRLEKALLRDAETFKIIANKKGKRKEVNIAPMQNQKWKNYCKIPESK